MGRHARPTDSKIRRNSVIAMTGLVPVGLVAAAATTAGASPRALLGVHQDAQATTMGNAVPETLPQVPEAVSVAQSIMLEPAPAPALAPKMHRLKINISWLTMATPLICTVLVWPTIMLSNRETKFVMVFWMTMGTATPAMRR